MEKSDPVKVPLDQLKKNWLRQVMNNRFRLCLESIEEVLADTSPCQEDFVLISSSLSSYENANIRGVISREDSKLEEQKIATGLQMFIRRLTQEDLSVKKWIQTQIHEKILVVTCDEKSQEKMQAFFNRFYFPLVSYDTSLQLLNEEELKKYDLVIFDYMYDASPKRFNLLKSYLENTDIPVLYFGVDNLRILKETAYAHRVHSANFVISLHTRLKEMIEFIKYYTPRKSELA